MTWIMAQGRVYFTIGNELTCTTCNGQKIEGEVIAFDQQTNMLALKCQNSKQKGNTCDVHFINLLYVDDVSLLPEKEAKPLAPLSNLNFQRLNQRLSKTKMEKVKKVNSVGQNVTSEAQQLFYHINKTIDDIAWRGQNITVMGEVRISAPYTPDSCRSLSNVSDHALQHVRKLVEKFHTDKCNSVICLEEASPVTEAQSDSDREVSQ
ncbi:PREDICTED: protein LSM12 homolog [Priapulus caudatus]|uniref:Protein LSM12 homolog n=1 Tax=Priapulus caudatus TaxID=37621 RepID=A0ABM1DUR5_PRICU|nr:PREDICTED: protein LSM12 homolog [Priapulus caudatus]XP_014663687.1 PREDICTED: protein LSM12 homolog [Priapulus caudatus]